jgi:glyoxylase I family protein
VQWTVEHLGLAADDPVALAEWYRGVLDGQDVFRCENLGKAPTVFIRLPGGLILEIYPAMERLSETALNSLRGWRHLALRVPSVEAAREQLAGRGVAFTEGSKPAGGGGRVLFFRDPEGNLLHLVERQSDPFI